MGPYGGRDQTGPPALSFQSLSTILDSSHKRQCELITHYSFDSHLPNDIVIANIYVFIGHLSIFWGNI